jgi:hypothetical protein
MAKVRTKQKATVPPQLLGVLEDAMRIAATRFRLETFPTHIMASFAGQFQATEIDFEMEAGQEMIDYLLARSSTNREGRFLLEYEGRRLECLVASEKRRRPSWVEVSWT